MEFGWLFTNLLTVAGVLYGWLNPFFGLMVYYTFAILRPTHLWFWSFGGTERHSFAVGLATGIGWIISGFGDWSNMRAILLPVIGMALFLASGAFAAQFGINPQRAWFYYDPQIKVGIMLLVTFTLVTTAKRIRIFAWVLTAGLCYLAYVFNNQYVFDNWNRIWSRGFGGIDNNGVAMIMVVGVPLAFFMGIKDRRWWVKGLCFFGVACLIHVVLFSFSRGGQLGLVLVGMALFMAVFFGLPNKGLTLLMGVAFLLITLRLAGQEVRQEFFSIFVNPEERDASAASRFDTWRAGWEAMKDNPLGLGPRNFNLVSRQYGLGWNKSVHNLFLQVGADYGFLGLFGLMLFYVGTIWQTFFMTFTRTARRLVWPTYFGHMVVISLGGFLVCSTFIGMESVEAAYLVSALGLCTVAYVKRQSLAEPSAELEVLPELEQVPLDGNGRLLPV